MKNIITLIICFASLNTVAQEIKTEFNGHTWEAPYQLSIPNQWTFERFLIPISFAPQIPYKGVEDIRFTPGWANVKTDDYWTYAFLWWLDESPAMDAQIIAGNVKAYYTGLIHINTDTTKRKTLPGEWQTVHTSFTEIKTQQGNLNTYNGTIDMLDFMLFKPIKLNAVVHVRSCPEANKTIVFYEISPMPFIHQVWKSLDKLWLDFSCKKTVD